MPQQDRAHWYSAFRQAQVNFCDLAGLCGPDTLFLALASLEKAKSLGHGTPSMSRMFSPKLCTLIFCIAVAGNASAATYYIAANGSDSNNGTSQTTPWAHLPGMASWAGSHTPAAGDTFILRGCDVWGNANFPITWTWSGSSANPITVDVDQTWYNTTNCPSGWNRPVFDAQSTAIQAPECTGGHINQFLSINSAMYATFRWVEARNFYWNTDQGNACWGTAGFIEATAADYITIDSWYIHEWTVGPAATDSDRLIGISNASPYCGNCMVTNTVIDNSDGNGNSGVGIQWSLTNSVVHDVVNAIKPWTQGTFGSNNIYNVRLSFDGATHPNVIETIYASGHGTGVFYFYNNLLHDITTGEGFQVGNPGETDYAWNNIWWNLQANTGGNTWDLPQSCSTGVTGLYAWNNTIVTQLPQAVNAGCGSWTNFYFQNNHAITSTGATLINGAVNATTQVIGNNVLVSSSNAASQGYTSSSAVVYSPQNQNCNGIPTNCPIGAGTNLTTLWPTGFTTDDTSYACSEQTVNGVVQSACPGRTSDTRPGNGSWDAGAYFYNASLPNPPTGLTAVVQ